MPTVYALLPDSKPHFLDSAGDPLSGGQLFIYTAGSSTKATTYTESDGLTPNSNPIVLNSRGETASGVYAATGSYKLVLAPANDTDPPASAIWTRDDVTPINDVANATATEWSSTGLTPTYISGTQFTVVGDQTTDHHVGRRIKATVSAGTVYGRITVSAYTSLTTVTVVLDSGALDAGLSVVDLGFLRADQISIPSKITTRGDLLRGSSIGIPERLAIGAAGQVLESDGTDAAWGWSGIVQRVTTQTGAVATGTTTIPADDTIPQITEGDQYMTRTITPKNTANLLVIEAVGTFASTANGGMTMALFTNANADALSATIMTHASTNGPRVMVLRHIMSAGTTSEITFRIRVGNSAAGTTTFNGISGSRVLGGVLDSSLTVTEIAT